MLSQAAQHGDQLNSRSTGVWLPRRGRTSASPGNPKLSGGCRGAYGAPVKSDCD